MNPRTIHETELAELVDKITNSKVINAVLDAGEKRNRNDISKQGSLARAASATTLVFPVLVSESLSSESASMVTKAIERKCVSLMQIALSAFNVSDATNIVDFLKDFHTNVDPKKLDLDTFQDIMDSVASQAGIRESFDYRAIAQISEDCKNNINYYFDDDFNDKSLSEFAFKRNGMTDVVIERTNYQSSSILEGQKNTALVKKNQKIKPNQTGSNNDNNLKTIQLMHQMEKDAKDEKRNQNNDITRYRMDLMSNKNNYFKNQLLSSDVKKANELVPSMMIVNVMTKSLVNDRELVNQQAIIGIKAKMYPVNPSETVTKIVTKHSDSNSLLKLVKVGTREISFFKDFLLAIDNAKIEALSKSKRGSSSKLFKVLERRALGGKVRKVLGRDTTCKPIFSLIISREEADYLINYNDIDVDNPSVVIPIMEKLNLMYFVILDESTETGKFLIDGDTEYETLSFSSLEKEVSDGGYKKVVNLVSKMNR